MMAPILLVLAWLFAVAGAALIALASRTHWMIVTGSPIRRCARHTNAAVGGALLLLTIELAVLRNGWGMGLLLGPLLIATGIGTVIAILASRPRSLRPIARVSGYRRRGPHR